MRPYDNPRVSRRAQRRAWRGHQTGRRTTHKIATTYGAGQALAAHVAFCAERRKELETSNA
jgi:hypothetical protein